MIIFDSENRERGSINNTKLIKIKRLNDIKYLHEVYISVPCSRLAAALKKNTAIFNSLLLFQLITPENYSLYESIIPGFFGIHPEIPVSILFHPFQRLPCLRCN